ncbi:sialate O-acetylesterase [Flavobacterium sp. RHBU_24]|uniref:sialate O-acetylesterase n=1 Tax=Flavobacterium sp. RHBU_24 TaxID=3391185 RepID=UPI003985001F
MKLPLKSMLPALLLFCAGIARAVTLPSFFTDNMVLQQKSTVPLFGGSTAKKVTVTTSWDKKEYEVFVKAGKWEVFMETPTYGGPYTITINDGKKTELKNILIGEVWLCSGQSNMEMPLKGWGKITNYEEEINNANYPEIRLLQAVQAMGEQPQDYLAVQHGGWQVCAPETIADFSSTAYFFARKVYREKHIPIGLIHSSWGGTVAEAWVSAGALGSMHDFDDALDVLNDTEGQKMKQEQYEADMLKWNAALSAKEGSMKDGKPLWAGTGYDDSAWGAIPVPSLFENNVLPDFNGVVWYRRAFEVAKLPSGAGSFEFAVDDDDMVWINDVYIGGTKGYNIDRKYTVPASALKKGRNVITVRVFDNTGGGGIYSPDDIALKFSGLTIPLAGTWKYKAGVNLKDLAPMPFLSAGPNRPSVLYNAMIYPLLRYKIAGAIWYQGESNAGRAQQYKTLFPLLIRDWRDKFRNEKLPFYFVQLANYKEVKTEPAPSDWAELREAQFQTLRLPNTGMAVITDIGDAKDIHPKNKQDVGLRLALIALAKTYGTDVAYSGPLYIDFKKQGSKMLLTFNHNQGITAKGGGALTGFEIAGEDKVFRWAQATVEGSRVVVWSDAVKNPIAVRYNWADNPQGNLTNASGLPASSFRTDTWPGVTEGKR